VLCTIFFNTRVLFAKNNIISHFSSLNICF
jgi:hypothetical protein